jgi:phage gp29-like protein
MADLEAAMKAAGSASYLILPDGVNVEFIESKTQASAHLYQGLIDECNKSLSILCLGQNLTTSDGAGSLAQAKIHQQVEHEIFVSDKLFVKNILNDKLLSLLQIHGYQTGDGRFSFQESEHIDLKTRLDMDLKLSEKIAIPDDYFYETYHIPKIKN